MSRRLLWLVLLLGCAHAPPPAPAPRPAPVPAPETTAPKATPGEQVLAHEPPVPPLEPFNAPVPVVTTLPNGLKIYVVWRPGEEIEALDLVIERGGTADPKQLEGLASMSAAMLETGAGGMSQLLLARALDNIGARLGVGATDDATIISMSALPQHLPDMVPLLADVALKPTLSAAEWKKLKAQRLAELIAERADPVAAIGISWRRATYGDHPLAHPLSGTPESIRRMQLADVRQFVQRYAPGDSAIVAVGGASVNDVRALVQKAFAGWKGRSKPDLALTAAVKAEPRPAPRFIAVDYPDKPQTVIRVGEPAVSRASPDYLALNLLNAILGGSFTSRLNQNLREVHGYTYGAGSEFAFGVGPGPFVVATSVKTDTTAQALEQISLELQRIVSQPLSEAELKKGKALLAFDLVMALQHAEGAAGAISSIFLYDLPLDEFRTFVFRLNGLTVEDVHAAAVRDIHPDHMTVGIAGDLSKVLPEISRSKALDLPAPQRWSHSGELLPFVP